MIPRTRTSDSAVTPSLGQAFFARRAEARRAGRRLVGGPGNGVLESVILVCFFGLFWFDLALSLVLLLGFPRWIWIGNGWRWRWRWMSLPFTATMLLRYRGLASWDFSF